jgi:tetratricopeptide (TPR) repeat protein
LLEAKDLKGLLALVKAEYSADEILQFVSGKCPDASKVASLTLAWIGCRECIPKLAERLRDPDPMVNQMAEHALWAIWFRLGNEQSNKAVCRGTQAINRQEYRPAIEHFSTAINITPNFSEAFNQRAIAYYLLDDFRSSIKDCERTVELMPCHFGAWAGMGHCYAHLGKLDQALKNYRKAIEINPHLEQIREGIVQIESQ